MANAPIMRCGCAGQGLMQVDGAYVPACVVHLCAEPFPVVPDLTGRVATCVYGNHEPMPSSPGLAFFEYRPGQESDLYYCGCHGWD